MNILTALAARNPFAAKPKNDEPKNEGLQATPGDSFGADVVEGSIASRGRTALGDGFLPSFGPDTAQRELREAAALIDAPKYVLRAQQVKRSNAKLRSVLATRNATAARRKPVASAGGTKPVDIEAAEAAQTLLQRSFVRKAMPHLLDAVYIGYSFAEIVWDKRDPRRWDIVGLNCIPAHWFAFDKVDGKTPLLAPAEAGGKWESLRPDQFIMHAPLAEAGVPTTAGIAFTAMFFAALVNVTLHDWLAHNERFGQPLVLGWFRPGKGEMEQANRRTLLRALQNIGREAWAMLPDGMKIEFQEASTRAASTDSYERLSRYLDELLAALVTGATLTSGTSASGSGSLALGDVHSDMLDNYIEADLDALALTLQEQFVEPYIRVNFPGAAIPTVTFPSVKKEDIVALSNAVATLVDRGLEVSQQEMRERLGLTTPDAGEALLKPSAAAKASPAGADAPANTAKEEAGASR